MKISVIGAGNVGKTLAISFSKAGHQVNLGVRDINKLSGFQTDKPIKVLSIRQSIDISDVIVITIPSEAVPELAKQIGDVSEKIIIDATNTIIKKTEYNNSFEALKSLTNCKNIVKCFNTTGFENMDNPNYGEIFLDMFVAGSSEKGKSIAINLCHDIGFSECYDIGGDDKVALIESFALFWINLAIFQKQGRNIGFKLLKR